MPTKSTVPVLAEVSVPAGGTKAAPAAGGASSAVSTTSFGRSGLNWRVQNGASAPGAAGIMTIQTWDGAKWFDWQTVAGDTAASSETSGTITIDAFVQGVRVRCYGHTTNPVTFEASFSALTP